MKIACAHRQYPRMNCVLCVLWLGWVQASRRSNYLIHKHCALNCLQVFFCFKWHGHSCICMKIQNRNVKYKIIDHESVAKTNHFPIPVCEFFFLCVSFQIWKWNSIILLSIRFNYGFNRVIFVSNFVRVLTNSYCDRFVNTNWKFPFEFVSLASFVLVSIFSSVSFIIFSDLIIRNDCSTRTNYAHLISLSELNASSSSVISVQIATKHS